VKNRSVVAVLLLTIVTFGIYAVYWQVSTKIEMNKRGATIPTAWFLIVPIVNIWWLWKYSQGVEKETNGSYSTVISFILLFLLGVIGMMIIQHEFNKGGTTSEVAPVVATNAAPMPVADVTPEQPAEVVPTEPAAPVADAAPQEDTNITTPPTAPTV